MFLVLCTVCLPSAYLFVSEINEFVVINCLLAVLSSSLCHDGTLQCDMRECEGK